MIPFLCLSSLYIINVYKCVCPFKLFSWKKVDGVGISKETCIIWGGVDRELGLFEIRAASPSSIVYVNGRKLKYKNNKDIDKNDTLSPIEEDDGVIILKHNDRIALGHCAYLLLVIDPALEAKILQEIKLSVTVGEETGGNNTSHGMTYDNCVHEVMLMRAHGENEYKERLMAFVIQKFRLPAVNECIS